MNSARVQLADHDPVPFSGASLCLHQVLHGTAHVVSPLRTHTLVSDGILIVNGGQPHRVEPGTGAVLSVELPANLANGERFAECLSPRDFRVDRATSRLIEDRKGPNLANRATELMDALLSARDESIQNYHLVDRRREDPTLAGAMDTARALIMRSLSRPLSLTEIAGHLAYSDHHFHRLFLRWHGVTVGRYVQQERMRRACRRLILEDVEVAAVAESCGFLSSTSFVRGFQTVTGMTPSAFRKARRHHREELKGFPSTLQSCPMSGQS